MDNTEIKAFYHYAWQEAPGGIDNIIQSGEYNEFYLYWQFEYDVNISPMLGNFINNHNIRINVVTCCADIDWIKNRLLNNSNIREDLLRVETWPVYWFMRSHFNMIAEKNDFYINKVKLDFKYPFLNFNGRTRNHRSHLIDQLVKRNYLDKGVVTYHKLFEPDGGFEWKYHDGSIITTDDDFTTKFSSYSFNEKFLQSFLHIPTETDTNVILISEKTAIPILCGLPFLTVGAKGFHKKLKELLLDNKLKNELICNLN